jgi:two-component system, LytTR family, sensor kinase
VIKTKSSFIVFLLQYALWWVIWIALCTIVLHRLNLSWSIALADASVTNLLLAFSGFGIINTNKIYSPQKGNYIYSLGYILILSMLVIIASGWILSYWFYYEPLYMEVLAASAPFRFLFSLLMITCMSLVSGNRYYAKQQEENQRRKEEADRLSQEAELSKLRQQLQPHFLFNSLNSISALAGSKPNEARKMIQQLSDFLRGTLKKDEQQLVTLEEEINHLQLYLEIEKVRFGHRLITEINIAENCATLKLPSLLLQPVTENAIKFGLYDTIGEVTINISATTENNMLIITVKNPFDPQTNSMSPGTGFGLSSVGKRLLLLYSRADLLETGSSGNMYTTIIRIPQFK